MAPFWPFSQVTISQVQGESRSYSWVSSLKLFAPSRPCWVSSHLSSNTNQVSSWVSVPTFQSSLRFQVLNLKSKWSQSLDTLSPSQISSSLPSNWVSLMYHSVSLEFLVTYSQVKAKSLVSYPPVQRCFQTRGTFHHSLNCCRKFPFLCVCLHCRNWEWS